MKKICVMFAFLSIVLLFASVASAVPRWYYGKLTRVWATGSGVFVVTLDSGEINGCKYQYAYFRPQELNEEGLASAYAMALSAFFANQKVGIIIDDELVDSNVRCFATSIDIKK